MVDGQQNAGDTPFLPRYAILCQYRMKRCELFSGSRISNVVEPHRSVVHQCDYWGGHVENDEWIEEENANEYDVRCLLLQSARRHRRRGVSLFQTRYSFIHTPFCSSLFVLEKKRPTAGSDVDAIRIKTRIRKKSSTKRISRRRRKSRGNSRICEP